MEGKHAREGSDGDRGTAEAGDVFRFQGEYLLLGKEHPTQLFSMQNWRFATAQHRAVSFNAAFLVATTFHRWANQTQEAVRLRRVEENYQAIHDRNDLKNALQTWKRNVRLRYATEDLQDVVADHLETGAWRVWSARL